MRFFNLFTPARTEIVRKKSIDVALCGRSERPQNRTDAAPCSSDVYNIGTRARRRTANIMLSGWSFLRRVLQIRRDFLTTCTQKSTRGKKSQVDVALCGRSMVEMLGVLAIIGVLSVGAIAGYSKAMLKYKLNKQTEQINYLMSSVLTYGTEFGYVSSATGQYSSQTLIPILKKLNVIPKEMYVDNNENIIKDALNNTIQIESAHEPDFKYHYYIMSFKIASSVESCRNIAFLMKEYSADIDQFIGGEDVNSKTYRYWGDKRCKSYLTCLKDVSLSEIEDLCNSRKESGSWYFHIQWGADN